MTNLTEIDLNTSVNAFFLILSIVLAIGISYFVYRKTIPPVSNGWRIVLITLRAGATILVLLLLFEPILSITRRNQEKPVVAVLMDQSASLALVDQNVDRSKVLYDILNSDFLKDRTDKYDKVYYPFSYQLFDGQNAAPDSLDLIGDGTDIRSALAELKERLSEKYFTSVILITDGANNLGENPARYAETYGLPIYPIAIGDPAEQNDVLITNYVVNEIVYAGTKIPIDVYIKSNGFQGNKITVSLLQGNNTLDSQVISLSGTGLEQKIRLHFTPEKEGLFKYEIKLPKLETELTGINNTKSFYVKVLKSKLKVLIISGGPQADYLFLKRTLTDDDNLDVLTSVEKINGAFYQNATLPSDAQLDKVDCLILLDYPHRTSSRNSINKIKGVLAKGKPVLFLFGKQVNLDKLWELKDYTPLASKPRQRPERSVYINILPQGLQHPVFRLTEDELENREKWKELPPVFTNLNSVSLHPKAQTLAVIDLQRSTGTNLPLIATYSSGSRKKSMAVFAYGLWRWDLLMWGVGKTNEGFQKFIQNAIRWLNTLEDSKLVRISSNKEIYRSGEEVKFIAQVYFEDYQPVDGAEVVVQLTGEKETQELTLENTGDGRYEGRFQVLEGGDYNFSGTAHLQGRVLGRDSGKFSVEEFSLEYQNTRMNEELLKRLATESGGAYYTADDFGELKEKLDFPEKYVVIKNEWEIWNKIPLLVACILLLSTEWFIRKRKGML